MLSARNDSSGRVGELWFQVSLFGAGRSAPGSVFSEGIGLTHDDKRNYVGEIVERKGRHAADGLKLFVSGSITVGSDFGTDARPEPVGRFQLFEISEVFMLVDDDERDGRSSVFE